MISDGHASCMGRVSGVNLRSSICVAASSRIMSVRGPHMGMCGNSIVMRAKSSVVRSVCTSCRLVSCVVSVNVRSVHCLCSMSVISSMLVVGGGVLSVKGSLCGVFVGSVVVQLRSVALTRMKSVGVLSVSGGSTCMSVLCLNVRVGRQSMGVRCSKMSTDQCLALMTIAKSALI